MTDCETTFKNKREKNLLAVEFDLFMLLLEIIDTLIISIRVQRGMSIFIVNTIDHT